jgi:hypothetical protein
LLKSDLLINSNPIKFPDVSTVSVSSVFSSKIEGENIELDSYIKHKRYGVEFLPDYTKKIDDLYEAYTFAKANELNEKNVSASEWGCTGTSIPGTQLAVGSGETNTSLIVAGCNQASFASKICYDLVSGGQTDWFLPSRDELNLMYKNLHTNNQGNFNTSSAYWSSTETDANDALYLDFGGWVDGNGYKNYAIYVRAVRAF